MFLQKRTKNALLTGKKSREETKWSLSNNLYLLGLLGIANHGIIGLKNLFTWVKSFLKSKPNSILAIKAKLHFCLAQNRTCGLNCSNSAGTLLHTIRFSVSEKQKHPCKKRMSAAKGLVTQGKIGLCTRSIKYQKTPPTILTAHGSHTCFFKGKS